MFNFEDQVAVVTGGAGNLGQAVVRALYAAGASVVIVDRRRETSIAAFGGDIPEGERCAYIAGDLTDAHSAAHIIESTVGKYGQIDILVNTAGGFRGGKPVHETPVETWDFLMDLNARTVFLMSRAAIPHMLPRRSGKIVNVAARAAMKGESGSGAYIASKMAVIRLTEALAEELKGEGINVNCILPGTLDTPENRSAAPDADFSKWVAPESMAGVILFLLSGLARDIHGAAVPVYGRS